MALGIPIQVFGIPDHFTIPGLYEKYEIFKIIMFYKTSVVGPYL